MVLVNDALAIEHGCWKDADIGRECPERPKSTKNACPWMEYVLFLGSVKNSLR